MLSVQNLLRRDYPYVALSKVHPFIAHTVLIRSIRALVGNRTDLVKTTSLGLTFR